MLKPKISIIGKGFVGNACYEGFREVADIRVYDKFKDLDSFEDTVNHSNIVFLCLPTPMSQNGSCDISILEESVQQIVDFLKNKQAKVFVIKSTVPPKTTEIFQAKYPQHTFLFNPEFLREVSAVEDFKNQDRIVIGIPNAKDLDQIHLEHEKLIEEVFNFYATFSDWQEQNLKVFSNIVMCNSSQAEMSKYIINCFLATKVIFFNEIYQICQALNINYKHCVDVATLDERIGKSHTTVPGPDGQFAFGGKCFPKDLNALRNLAEKNDINTLILDSVWKKNLQLRDDYDWENIPGATTKNMNFSKKINKY